MLTKLHDRNYFLMLNKEFINGLNSYMHVHALYIHFVDMKVSHSGKDQSLYTCVDKYIKSVDKAFQ
jgi:hypothetical protein